MNFLFEKVAFITGASSGIGAGTAVHFSTLGCSLALVGRNMDHLKNVAAKCNERGLESNKILLLNADVTKEKQVKDAVAKAVAKFKKIDIVVNSAGCMVYGGLECSSELFDEVIRTNVKSIFNVCQAAEPHLIDSKGVIINVSSTCSLRSSPGMMLFGLSKAAIDHMTKTLALELASKQVRVNSVNPGIIHTPIHGKSNTPWISTDEQICIDGKKWHPLGRIGQVDDVAKAIAFLASDEAGYITGELLPVDGGKHASQPSPMFQQKR